MAHWRATSLAASDRKETTRALYATLCRKHLEPAPFGAIPLDKLKPTDVEALMLSMRAKTKLSSHGSTVAAVLTAAEAIVAAGTPGAVIVSDDFGDDLDTASAEFLAAKLRRGAGQLWLSTSGRTRSARSDQKKSFD